MIRKLWLFMIPLLMLSTLSSLASADILVGVKRGDWIEYNVNYTGIPLAGHGINWARMEVIDVQGKNVSITITSRFPDGRTEVSNATLNLQTGYLIDNFIIPANLTEGDTFYDQNLGDVIIQRTEMHTYAGVTRTVLYFSTDTNTYVWDQTTGVSVEGSAQESNYTIHTIVEDTNMWEPSFYDSDVTNVHLIAVLIIVIIIVLISLLVRFRKKNAR